MDRDLGLGQIAAPTEEPMAMDAGAGQPQQGSRARPPAAGVTRVQARAAPADDGPLIDGYDDNLFGGRGEPCTMIQRFRDAGLDVAVFEVGSSRRPVPAS